MDQYCVVMCGLQTGASDDASAWLPVAAALKLDHAEFERRVVAALPRIVRGHLDQVTAARIAQLLHAMHVDARVLPDDPQLAYIDRAGATCGPLPQSSLADFILPGESYRLRGDTAWQPWPEPLDQTPTASATLAVETDDIDDAMPSSSTGDEAIEAMPTTDTMDEVGDTTPDELAPSADDESQQVMSTPPHSDDGSSSGDAAQDVLPTDADVGEAHRVMPPPLPVPPTVRDEPTSEPPGDPQVAAPDTDADGSMDDELINDGASVTAESDASITTAPETAEAAAPKRSPIGRLLVLLVLVVLAVWAYRHWMSDTRMDGSPAAPTAMQPSDPASGRPAAPGPAVPGDDSMPIPVSAASVAAAASTPAPTSTSAAPAAASSTPASATTATALAKPTSTAIPAGATSAPPAPASNAQAGATDRPNSSGTLPARAGTISSARSAPAATEPAKPAH